MTCTNSVRFACNGALFNLIELDGDDLRREPIERRISSNIQVEPTEIALHVGAAASRIEIGRGVILILPPQRR